jgi:cytochrome c-type biogenesis protein CcmH/NrfG
MSESEYQKRANELSRLWQGQIIPVEDEAATEQQKARVVPSIASAIGKAAVSRRKGLRLRKLAGALSVAACALGIVGVGRFIYQSRHEHPASIADAHVSGYGRSRAS